MALRDISKNTMLEFESGRLTHVSLHWGHPATVANEITGGTYARQPIAWRAPTNGVLSKATTHPTFQIPAVVTVVAIGLGGSTGEPRVDSPVAAVVFDRDGTYTVTAALIDLNA